MISLNSVVLCGSAALLCYFLFAVVARERTDRAHTTLLVATLAVFIFAALYFFLKVQLMSAAGATR